MFKTQVQSKAIEKALGVLASRVKNLKPMLSEVGNEVMEVAKASFDKQADPFGLPWKKLAESTKRSRRKGGGAGDDQILRDTGALLNSINVKVTSNAVEIGSDRIYSGIHQWGGTVNIGPRSGSVRLRKVKGGRVRFAKKRHKRVKEVAFQSGPYSVTIPARPFLPMTKAGALPLELSMLIQKIIWEHVKKTT